MVRKIKLIYNPVAGDTYFTHRLDEVVEFFRSRGVQLIPVKLLGPGSADAAIAQTDREEYMAVIAAGGDGTLHYTVNALLKGGLADLPLGIIPAGTANDFATHLNLPRDISQCCQIILAGKTRSVDIGQANDRYFINVASAGLLADVSQKVDVSFKNVFGKMAYYLKGLEQIPKFCSVKLTVISDAMCLDEDVFLILVLNGNAAGGFTRLAPFACVDDGLLDVIVVRDCFLPDLFRLFLKTLKGQHLYDARIHYFKTAELTIAALRALPTDLDGEPGPDFPLRITVQPKALKVFVP